MAGPHSEDPTNPNLVTLDDDGVLRDSDNDVVVCSWTAQCEQSAVAVQKHPILLGVPVCGDHQAWIDKMKS